MSEFRLAAFAALAVAVVLGVQVAAGGLHYAPAAVPDPCAPHPWSDTHGLTDIEQKRRRRVVGHLLLGFAQRFCEHA